MAAATKDHSPCVSRDSGFAIERVSLSVIFIFHMTTTHVTVADLQRDEGRAYLGRRLRIATLDDYASPTNQNGIALPRPTLQRSTVADVPTYGEQALEPNTMYTFGGASDGGYTLVFINCATDMPLQIYSKELPGAVFVLEAEP